MKINKWEGRRVGGRKEGREGRGGEKESNHPQEEKAKGWRQFLRRTFPA